MGESFRRYKDFGFLMIGNQALERRYDNIWKAIKRIFFLLAKMVVGIKYFCHSFWPLDYFLYELKKKNFFLFFLK